MLWTVLRKRAFTLVRRAAEGLLKTRLPGPSQKCPRRSLVLLTLLNSHDLVTSGHREQLYQIESHNRTPQGSSEVTQSCNRYTSQSSDSGKSEHFGGQSHGFDISLPPLPVAFVACPPRGKTKKYCHNGASYGQTGRVGRHKLPLCHFGTTTVTNTAFLLQTLTSRDIF